MEVIYFLLFIIAGFFSFYIPGKVVGSYFNITAQGYADKLLSLTWGIVIFILTAYILASLHIPQFQYAVIAFFALVYFFIYRQHDSWNFKGIDRVSLVIIILGSLVALSITATSGILTSHGWQYVGINAADGLVHISRIKNFVYQFPPTHPGLAGITFRGYHYFYDFLLSRFIILFGFSAEDLYFRFFSLLVALLYGFSIFAFSSKIIQKKLPLWIIMFGIYFSTSFGFVVVMVNKVYGSMIVDPVSMITDPSIFMSVSILMVAVMFLPLLNNYKKAILLGIVIGSLSQIKIYAGLAGIAVVSTYLVYDFIRYRWKHFRYYFLLNVVAAIVTAVTFFPNNLGVGSLVFDPLLFYSHYVQQAFFNPWHWEIRRTIFAQHSNYPRIIILYAEAFVVFWVLALGLRILPLIFSYKLFRKEFWKKDYNFILAVIFAVCLLIPSLFIQSISVFDISQFFWILVALINIPLGISLYMIYKRKSWIGSVLIAIFIVFSLLGMYTIMKQWVFVPQTALITNHDAQILVNLERQVSPQQYIAVLPLVVKGKIAQYQPSLISAVTGRSTYYEDEIIKYPVGDVYTQRESRLLELYKEIRQCKQQQIKNTMNQIGTKYLVTYDTYPCLAKSSYVKDVQSGDKIHAYEFK